MDFIIHFLREIVIFFNEVAIYLLFGFFVAAILHIFFPESMIRRHLGKDSLGSVIKATLFGIPLPICSCGVVPVATSLKNSGASKGATVSFLITTPQVGADSFMITYSLLGWVFGVFRIFTSMVTGLLAGIFVNIFGKNDDGTLLPMAITSKEESWQTRARNTPRYLEYELLGSIANPLLVGFLVAGLIAVFIPDGFFEMYMGSDFLSMLLMLVIGIPMYVCASASTPIAASLIMKGMSPGAALVFLLTGPATNAIGISTITKVVGKKSTVIYLLVISLASLGFGYMLNLFVGKYGFSRVIMLHNTEMLPHWLKLGGSVALLMMLAWYYVDTTLIRFLKEGRKNMTQKVTLNVSGMSCMHCSGSVKKAVEGVDGTSNVSVDLNGRKVMFDITENSFISKVKDAITFAGFVVENP
ncbi:MAG: permease [Proteobacteria bacterium]|nr:permease [Pseudomonadota bacterium]